MLKVKKDFLNLVCGDEIQVLNNGYDAVYFSVTNRTQDYRFYGNEKGEWSMYNRRDRLNNEPSFIIRKGEINNFTAIEFCKIPPRPPHPTEDLKYADGTENWMQKNIDKIIQDLVSIDVIEII